MPNEIFYDFETTGTKVRFDQALQYGAVFVDDDFKELEVVDIRSRLARYILPTPGGLRVNHTNPYDIAHAKYSPFEFACHIYKKIEQWIKRGNTDFSGWNSISFDEEITRQMMWTNLLYPYQSSNKDNRRVDYIKMTRALAAYKPEALTIPLNEDKKPSFKLEKIAPTNGFKDHKAHDALGDVRATIHMARLIRDKGSNLFEHCKKMGSKSGAEKFVDYNKIFRFLNSWDGPTIEDVAIITKHPEYKTYRIAWNLSVDPLPFLKMESNEIYQAMSEKDTSPFRTIACNKQPMAFPMNWGFKCHSAGDDVPSAKTIDFRAKMVTEDKRFIENVCNAFKMKSQEKVEPKHLEEKIYTCGFLDRPDKEKINKFHKTTDWKERYRIALSFDKLELKKLAERIIWNEAPEFIPEDRRKSIDKIVTKRLFNLDDTLPWTTYFSFMKDLKELEKECPKDEELEIIRQWILETSPRPLQ